MREAFYILAAIAIISSFVTVIQTNAIHALLYFVISLFSVSVIFFILGAPFAAALEVIIYAGAIMVLFVFVVMILNLGMRSIQQEKKWLSPKGWLFPSILGMILLTEVGFIFLRSPATWNHPSIIAPQQVSRSLFGPYRIGVEFASVLLLTGLIGAYHLGSNRGDRK